IVDVPATPLAIVGHAGSFLSIGKAFDRLYATLGSRNLLAEGMRSVALFLDNPTSVPEAALRSQAGVVVDGAFPIAPPLERAEIRPGPYVVLRHKGPYS